ncbi:MAG: hypothetical protein ABIP95_01280 [Pelobium sp.]
MKNPKPTDEFNLRNTLWGVGVILIDSNSHIHDYIHSLSFKKELKEYEKEFGESRFRIAIGLDFCRSVNDIIVRHGLETCDLLKAFLEDFYAENGTFCHELLCDDIANREHLRFGPKEEHGKLDSQNYDETALAYCQFLKKIIKSLYYSCCAITLESYQIPHKMKTNIYYTVNTNFRFLDRNQYDIKKFISLIKALQYRVVSINAILQKFN